jgi:hypothetical protein
MKIKIWREVGVAVVDPGWFWDTEQEVTFLKLRIEFNEHERAVIESEDFSMLVIFERPLIPPAGASDKYLVGDLVLHEDEDQLLGTYKDDEEASMGEDELRARLNVLREAIRDDYIVAEQGRVVEL